MLIFLSMEKNAVNIRQIARVVSLALFSFKNPKCDGPLLQRLSQAAVVVSEKVKIPHTKNLMAQLIICAIT